MVSKISDLKIGDKVITKKYGKGHVSEVINGSVKLKLHPNIKKQCPYFVSYEIDWQKTNELNNNKMNEILIEAPTGMEIYQENNTIKFRNIENKLPMSVEEIKKEGHLYYINNSGVVHQTTMISRTKNDLSTKERAEAFLALMQLVELRDSWNGDWKVDHTTPTQPRYNIFITKGVERTISFILCFKSLELKEQFEEQFKDLIETAKELL